MRTINSILKINPLCFLPFIIALCVSAKAQQDSSTEALVSDSAQVNVEDGEVLFRANCAKCHFICEQGIGPALAGVTKRRERSWLVSFIKNSQQVIGSGDKYALHLFESYNRAVMPEFKNLSSREINNILDYIDERTVDTFERSKVNNALSLERINVDEENKVDYYQQTTERKIPVTTYSVNEGRRLFLQNCDVCHDLCAEKNGPPLSNVTFRRPLPWLLEFIKNPKDVLEKGDNYALFIAGQYEEVMPPTHLDENEILSILSYIRDESGSPNHISGVNSPESLNDLEIDQRTQKVERSDGEVVSRNYPEPERRNSSFVIVAIVVVVGTLIAFGYFLIKISKHLEE